MIEEISTKGLMDPQTIQKALNEVTDVVGMITQSQDYMNIVHNDHILRGALRSGTGTPQQAYERIKLFEEEELLD